MVDAAFVSKFNRIEMTTNRIHSFMGKDGEPHDVVFHRANERFDLELFKGIRIFTNLGNVNLENYGDQKEYYLQMASSLSNISSPYAFRDTSVDISGGIFFSGTMPWQIREIHERITGKHHNMPENPEIRDGELRMEGDLIVAASIIDSNGNIKEIHDDEAYVLYWEWLNGDDNAYEELKRRFDYLSQMQENSRKNIMGKTTLTIEEDPIEPLHLKELVAVHTTKYMPRKGKIHTRYDATGIPRGTVHFSLNHPVSSHMYGSWDQVPYVIISPLKDTVIANGNPSVLNTVDTIFEPYPEEGVKLPESAVIVRPQEAADELDEADLYIRIPNTNQVVYRTNFEQNHIGVIINSLGRFQRRNLNDMIREKLASIGCFSDIQYPENYEESWITEVEHERIISLIGDPMSSMDFASLMTQKPIKEILEDIFLNAEINNPRTQEVVATIESEIKRFFVSEVKTTAVYATIQSMGFVAHDGGMWAWDGDSRAATRQTQRLGSQIEVPVMPHSDHITHKFEEFYIGGWGIKGIYTRLKKGEIDFAAFREELYKYVARNASFMSSQMLHMLLSMGAF